MTAIRQEVIDAILRGTLRVTRRAEIYESDGKTLWSASADTPRLVSGSVSVDANRSERRMFDAVFDNSDDVLDHNPDGFWYDKIIKFYRGISYDNERTIPKILIMYHFDLTNISYNFAPVLRKLGFVDVTVNTAVTTVEELDPYDIILYYRGWGSLSTASKDLLVKAYEAGKAVFTWTLNDTSATNPLITTTTARAEGQVVNLTVGSYDSPIKKNLATGNTFTAQTSASEAITAWRSTALKAIDSVYSSTVYAGGLYETNASGGRWYHMQYVIFGASTYLGSRNWRTLITNIINWLYNYTATRTWETQIGEFMIDNIQEKNSSKLISVAGRDYTKKLLAAKFTVSDANFPSGTRVDDIVKSVAANAGITKFLLGAHGVRIDTKFSYARTDERWKIIQEVCHANNVEVYFDAYGYLVTRPFRDPFSSPVTLSLSTGGTKGNLVSFEKSSHDSQLANVVVVTGKNADSTANGDLYKYIATNTEPSSPTRVARLGERYYFEESASFTSQAQVEARAKALLKVVALEEFELGFSSLVFPWLDAGDIFEFTDPDRGVDEPTRFLLTNFNIPLTLGPMTGTGKRITIVGSAT